MALEINDIQISSTATKQGKLIIKRHVDTVDPTVNDDSSAGYDMGDRWMNSTSDDEFVLCDASVGAAVWKKTTGAATAASDMATVSLKRSTTLALTATAADVLFDVEDVENEPTILEHDDVNTARIYLHESSHYFGTLSCEILNSNPQDKAVDIELWLNGTSLLSSASVSLDKNSSEHLTRVLVIPPLTPGDYVTIRLGGADLTLKADARVNLFQMSGTAGATGAQGPAGTNGTNGADGDITWEGVWVSQNYVTNQAVEYQGSSYVCHTNTTSSQVPTDTNYWDVLAEKGDPGPSGSGGKLALAFSAQNKHGLNSTATVYTVMASCLFTGTDDFTPSIIKCCVNSDGTGNTQWVKIYDVTNSQTIAEGSWAESTSLSIQDLGTLSNLSTGPAHWEIQMKIDAGTNQFNMYNMTVY